MLLKWSVWGEPPTPWVLEEDTSDFPAFVRRLSRYAEGAGLLEGFVPSAAF